LLRAQARIARLKRQTWGEADRTDEDEAAARTNYDDSWRASVRHIARRMEAEASWFGLPNILIALLAASCTVGGLIWNIQRHPALPPNAGPVTETVIEGFARQTSFRVPAPIDEVRAFYQEELDNKGWRYCGTRATPRCTNLTHRGAEYEVDVYRRPDDHNFTGLTIEIWAQRDPNGQTFVRVFETRPWRQ